MRISVHSVCVDVLKLAPYFAAYEAFSDSEDWIINGTNGSFLRISAHMFRNPETGEEIARVRNLKELQNILFAVPAESFLYHISRNSRRNQSYQKRYAAGRRPFSWSSCR